MTLENLMIKAIREFKKAHKNAEIRSCCLYECTGSNKTVKNALFHIEFVEEIEGEYKSVDIKVFAQ